MASSSSKGNTFQGPKRGLRDRILGRRKDKSPSVSQSRDAEPTSSISGPIAEDRVLRHDENIQLTLRPGTLSVPPDVTNDATNAAVVGDAGNDGPNGVDPLESHAPTMTEQVFRPIPEVWDEAYEDLRVEDEDLITKYEAKLRESVYGALAATAGKTEKQVLMKTVVDQKLEQYQADSWKVKALGEEFLVKDIAKPLVGIVKWADKYVGDALKTNPMASIGWAGVMVFIPVRLYSVIRES